MPSMIIGYLVCEQHILLVTLPARVTRTLPVGPDGHPAAAAPQQRGPRGPSGLCQGGRRLLHQLPNAALGLCSEPLRPS